MTQDRIGKAKSWCIEVAEATPVGVEVAPTWADVGRLIGDIVRAVDPSYLMESEIVRGDTRYYISIISVKRRSFAEGDDETNSSRHTNIDHVTVHSSVSMWDTAQSVAV